MPAFAHTGDPETSHKAAASISEPTLQERQQAVLHLLRRYGLQTATEIDQAYLLVYGKTTSYSGLKTRVTELVRMGLVRDSGQRKMAKSGRNHVLWQAVPPDEIDPNFKAPLTRKEQADKDREDLSRYRTALFQMFGTMKKAEDAAELPGNRGQEWHRGQIALIRDLENCLDE